MNQLEKLKKADLMEIIAKLNKKQLIEIINNKIGGNSNNVERIPIEFNIKKLKKEINIAMANDKLYNNTNNQENK